MNEGTMEGASAGRAGKGEQAGPPGKCSLSAAKPGGQACETGETAPQAKAARARMSGGRPFCALRGAQRKMARRADWTGCAEVERGGAESY